MAQNFSKYVHYHNGRYVIAQYKGGRYYAPQRPDIVKLTGAGTIFGDLDYVAGNAYSYSRKYRALAKAKELYGDPWDD